MRLSVGPHTPAMPQDDALCDGQPHPRPPRAHTRTGVACGGVWSQPGRQPWKLGPSASSGKRLCGGSAASMRSIHGRRPAVWTAGRLAGRGRAGRRTGSEPQPGGLCRQRTC